MTNIILNGEKLKYFQKFSEQDNDIQPPHLLFTIVIENIHKATKK